MKSPWPWVAITLGITLGSALAVYCWRSGAFEPAGPEGDAVRAVKKRGGLCLRANTLLQSDVPHDWVEGVEGNPVVEVDLSSGHILNAKTLRDPDLEALRAFTQLRQLNLIGT